MFEQSDKRNTNERKYKSTFHYLHESMITKTIRMQCTLSLNNAAKYNYCDFNNKK